jgi:glycosyltransferase involved in cell wall biosynthesis
MPDTSTTSLPPRRIARVIARLNVGGPARHVVWLTEAFNDGELETQLVTGVVPPGEDDMSQFAIERGVTPLIIPEMSRELSPRDVVTIWKLFRFFCRYRPDIVHSHTAKAGAASRIAGLLYRLTPSVMLGRRRRPRFVHTYHGHVFHSYYGRLKTRVFLTIERLLASLTDAIVVLSEQQRREIHDEFRVGRGEQFHVVPLGVDFQDVVAGERRASTETIVGIVGRLTAVKNHAMFLRVASMMTGRDIRFGVYGDGSDRAALEQIASASRLANVTFAGTKDAREIYAELDIAALTSLNEGTPLTLIEALANGIPIISTAVGGVVDLLGQVEQTIDTNGRFEVRERGVTVASNDDAGFAAGLLHLLQDAPLRKRLAERGRAFATANYSKQRLVSDLRSLYTSLLASP